MQTFTPAKIFIRLSLAMGFTVSSVAVGQGWRVDFSRRTSVQAQSQVHSEAASREPASRSSSGFLSSLRLAGEPVHEIVILNTEDGFVPARVSLQIDQTYKIHVVNVNAKNKNVSFIVDAFSQHHGTYFGEIKSFLIRPSQPGIVTFQSPETSAQGQMMVFSSQDLPKADVRQPASR